MRTSWPDSSSKPSISTKRAEPSSALLIVPCSSFSNRRVSWSTYLAFLQQTGSNDRSNSHARRAGQVKEPGFWPLACILGQVKAESGLRLCIRLKHLFQIETHHGEKMKLPGRRQPVRNMFSRPVATSTLKVLVAAGECNGKNALTEIKSFGIRADSLAQGSTAWEAALRIDYDFIFVDCATPEMDGYEATHQIRQNGARPRTTIIGMTAETSPEELERCLDAGMDDCIRLPVRFANLAEILFPRWPWSALRRRFLEYSSE